MEAGDLSLHGPGLCGSLHTNSMGTDFTLLTEGRLGFLGGERGRCGVRRRQSSLLRSTCRVKKSAVVQQIMACSATPSSLQNPLHT